MTRPASERWRAPRWSGTLEVLAFFHRQPGITRAALARGVGLTSGSATEIVARLRELALVREVPAPAVGRGRPTTVLGAHPEGPLVLAVDLRQEDWRLAVAGLDGLLIHVGEGRHQSRSPRSVLSTVGAAISVVRARYGRRVRVISMAVSGTIQGERLVQAATLGWGEVDLAPLLRGMTLPFYVGNDATLAGVAEARVGAAADARTALHLVVEVGLGGILVVDGAPVTGATGAGGEFGHMPLGASRLRCPCGARGCWELLVDGRAMARRLGEPPPENAVSFARAVLERSGTDRSARRVVEASARDLGVGTAGLVNALDPDVVTLGGLAASIFALGHRTFLTAYSGGLMAFRRSHPPEVRCTSLGDDGALRGAAEVGLDAILTEDCLESWAREVRRSR